MNNANAVIGERVRDPVCGMEVDPAGAAHRVERDGASYCLCGTVTSVAIDKAGHVFVADFYNHRIQKFAADGTFLTAFGIRGSGPGQFNHAIAMAVADDGTVFAVDFGNNRVEKWQP